MGLWDIAKALGSAAVETSINDYNDKTERYQKTSDWASRASDDALKHQYKSTSDAFKKKAIYDELKRRGY